MQSMRLSQVKSNIDESNSSHFKFIIIAICSLINMMMAFTAASVSTEDTYQSLNR